MAPDETRYMTIAAAIIIITPLLLGGYAYWFLKLSYAHQRTVHSVQTQVRILDKVLPTTTSSSSTVDKK